MFYTAVNINFYWYLPQKLLLVIILSVFFALLGPVRAKAARRTFMKLTPDLFACCRWTEGSTNCQRVEVDCFYCLILKSSFCFIKGFIERKQVVTNRVVKPKKGFFCKNCFKQNLLLLLLLLGSSLLLLQLRVH